MSRKKPITTSSQIRSALRQLFLRSRERAKCIKDANGTCSCGKKQSKAKGREVKINVHHVHGIDWDGLIDLVRERLLSGEMEVKCVDCHAEEHGKQKNRQGA